MTRVLAGPSRRSFLVILAATAVLLAALIPSSTDGSSHREAPLIAATRRPTTPTCTPSSAPTSRIR